MKIRQALMRNTHKILSKQIKTANTYRYVDSGQDLHCFYWISSFYQSRMLPGCSLFVPINGFISFLPKKTPIM